MSHVLRPFSWALLALPLSLAAQTPGASDSVVPPAVFREFRGLWVAVVNNMDWPSRAGLSTEEQQGELIAILDRAAQLKMNAIVFQVRMEADALYESPFEPWSRYLTGRQGRAPSPLWDPLKFAVDESHRRGLELHAWFNPYRVAYWRDSLNAASHVTVQRKDLVRIYGPFLWLDPGEPDSRALMLRSVLDVVRRYDVDGVHIDDYFYPYPEKRGGETIEFPDKRTYDRYRRGGGTLERSDWRRANVDDMVRQFYGAVKAVKPWVKVGISPFGIWRPGYPETIAAGIDQHEDLYADVRRWLQEGWLDYLAPQLYWPVRPAEQSYPVLLRWWVEQNSRGREIWPGMALYKLPMTGPRKMTADDILEEVELTRAQPGARGHVHFNARVLMNNVERVADRLSQAYSEPALVPAMPWLDSIPPDRPLVWFGTDVGVTTLHFGPGGPEAVARWLVRARTGGVWRTTILPGAEQAYILKGEDARANAIAVAAVDRVGNIGPAALVRRP